MPPSAFLSIHTVFIARENISFLREWIIYHSMLGVGHFYLYDNSGSIGFAGSTPTTNKYGIGFYERTKDRTDDDIEAELTAIIRDAPVEVTLLKWQPRDRNNNIVYEWNSSARHCIQTYGRQIEWMAFLDVDEFLFSEENVNVIDYLKGLDRTECSRVIVLQKKFLDRFLGHRAWVTDIYDCIEGIDTSRWAPKNLIRVEDLDLGAIQNMHVMPVLRRATVRASVNELRFNHYNVNPALLEWMKGFYATQNEFTLNAKDYGMKRYKRYLRRKFGRTAPGLSVFDAGMDALHSLAGRLRLRRT